MGLFSRGRRQFEAASLRTWWSVNTADDRQLEAAGTQSLTVQSQMRNVPPVAAQARPIF